MKTQFLNFVQNIANSVFAKNFLILKISVKGVYRRVLVAKENLKEAIKKAYEVANDKGLKIVVMGNYKAQKDYYITSFFNGFAFVKDQNQIQESTEPAPVIIEETNENLNFQEIENEEILVFLSPMSLENLTPNKPTQKRQYTKKSAKWFK